MKPLEGKVCLVTGGSRGIGRAIAVDLAAAGADVVVDYRHNQEAAEETARLCIAEGVKSKAYQVDVADAASVDKLMADITAEFGAVTIAVNNAGINRDKSFIKMTREMWDEVIKVDLGGPFNVSHAVLPGMIEAGWGRIINISSMGGETGNFGQANYSAAKGGLIAFTKTLARELARRKITVNSVSPGYTLTDMTSGMPEKVVDQVNAMIPMGRMAAPEEIAKAVTFLATPDASYITGQVLSVNGGMYM